MSRGSALYTDPAGTLPDPRLPDLFACRLDDGSRAGKIQEVRLTGDSVEAAWRPVRPLPADQDFFENVWREWRENGSMED